MGECPGEGDALHSSTARPTMCLDHGECPVDCNICLLSARSVALDDGSVFDNEFDVIIAAQLMKDLPTCCHVQTTLDIRSTRH